MAARYFLFQSTRMIVMSNTYKNPIEKGNNFLDWMIFAAACCALVFSLSMIAILTCKYIF